MNNQLTTLTKALIAAEAKLKENNSMLQTVNRRLESLQDRDPYVSHYRLEKNSSTLLERVDYSLRNPMVGERLKEAFSEAIAKRKPLWEAQLKLIDEVERTQHALKEVIAEVAPQARKQLEAEHEKLVANATKAILPFAASQMEAEEKAASLSVPAMALARYIALRDRLVSGSLVSQAWMLAEVLSEK